MSKLSLNPSVQQTTEPKDANGLKVQVYGDQVTPEFLQKVQAEKTISQASNTGSLKAFQSRGTEQQDSGASNRQLNTVSRTTSFTSKPLVGPSTKTVGQVIRETRLVPAEPKPITKTKLTDQTHNQDLCFSLTGITLSSQGTRYAVILSNRSKSQIVKKDSNVIINGNGPPLKFVVEEITENAVYLRDLNANTRLTVTYNEKHQ
ncbi:MAG: hypothetical protein VX438_18590 [Planctomycetota bacterium]|nr:hypothetical protein [Planctomycetota bacterium]